MNITAVLAIAFLCLLDPSTSAAREPTDVSLEILLKAGEGKQEAFDQATEQATRKLGEDLIGPEKIESAWAHTKSKILKNSARYVLFIRGSAPTDGPEGQKVTVQMRLAPDALETLLREFGLFSGASVRVLPMFQVAEARGSRYAWWAGGDEGPTPSLDYFKRTLAQLNGVAKGKSIYIMDPTSAGLRAGIPSSYRTETLRREDQLLLAQYLKADVVISGRVDVTKAGDQTRLNLNFEVWQARTGRAVTDAGRSEVVPSDQPKVVAQALDQATKRVFSELTTKLGEAAAGGALNLNTVRLVTEGNLNFRQQSDVRKALGELREIRAVRERLFEPGRVTYEVDTPKTGTELGRVLERTRLGNFGVAVAEARDEGVILNVRPVPSGGQIP